jgi:hypothetical protein
MRDPSILPEMAALTWLAYLDRRADVTGVSAVFHPESLLYVGVPFFRTGASLVDGLCGVRLPASLL